jgi:hypothetical protein
VFQSDEDLRLETQYDINKVKGLAWADKNVFFAGNNQKVFQVDIRSQEVKEIIRLEEPCNRLILYNQTILVETEAKVYAFDQRFELMNTYVSSI